MLTQNKSEAAVEESKLLQRIGITGAGPCHAFEVACAILADYQNFHIGFGFRRINQQMAEQLHSRLGVLRAWKGTAVNGWRPRPSYEREGRRVCFLTAPPHEYAQWDLYAFSNWDLALKVVGGVMDAGGPESGAGIDWCKEVHERLRTFFGGHPHLVLNLGTRCAEIIDGILAELVAALPVAESKAVDSRAAERAAVREKPKNLPLIPAAVRRSQRLQEVLNVYAQLAPSERLSLSDACKRLPAASTFDAHVGTDLKKLKLLGTKGRGRASAYFATDRGRQVAQALAQETS